jgi:hypothetical protein
LVVVVAEQLGLELWREVVEFLIGSAHGDLDIVVVRFSGGTLFGSRAVIIGRFYRIWLSVITLAIGPQLKIRRRTWISFFFHW